MDRNAVVASILIAVIMAVWLLFFTPTPPERPPAEEQQPWTEQEGPRRTPEPELRDDEPARAEEAVAGSDSLFLDLQEGSETFVKVESDLYTAVFSTRGGTLKSFRLKEYKKFDQVTPVEMVDTEQGAALSVLITPRRGSLLDSRKVFFEPDGPYTQDGDTLRLDVGDDPEILAFTAHPAGSRLQLVYTFTPKTYEVQLEVRQTPSEAFNVEDGYDLVWHGGIPFSEGDPEQEALASGAYVRSGGEVVKIGLDKQPTERQLINGRIEWVAVKETFFAAFIIPQSETEGAELDGVRVGETTDPGFFERYAARIVMPDMAVEGHQFKLYIGPLEYKRINDYKLGLYDVVDYGFGQSVTRPIARFMIMPVFDFLARFIPNMGVIILLFALIVKIVLYPMTQSSFKSMAKMRTLQPALAEIKVKHADNPQKQQEAMMRLYKESGVNPIGSCLPQLLQLPILYALFRFFPSAIEMRQASFLWATDLSAPDVILNLPFSVPLYGNYVAGFTLLMGASLFVQMKLQGSVSAPGQSQMQAKIFQYLFPVMLFVVFNRFASGLSLYYLGYNVVTAVQQQFINKSLEKEKKPGEEVASEEPKKPRSDRPKPKQAPPVGGDGAESAPASAKRRKK